MRYFTLFLFLFTLTLANNALSQVSGEMTKYNITHHGCEMESVTATWNLSTLMGEPVVGGNFKWEAPRGGDESCLSYNDFIIIKVQSDVSRDSWGWISISPGSTPRAGQGYPFNVSGSPRWNRLICGFDRNGNRENCFDSDNAKYFWQQGFSVTDFMVMRRSR